LESYAPSFIRMGSFCIVYGPFQTFELRKVVITWDIN